MPLPLPRLLRRRRGRLCPGVPAGFAVACACGHALTGRRTGEAQVRACPACGADVFILPLGPYPDPADRPAAGRRRFPASFPALLGLAVVVCAVTVLGLSALFWWLGRPGDAAPDRPAPPAGSLPQHVAALDAAAAQGHFHAALDELEVVRQIQAAGGPVLIEPDTLDARRRELALYRDLLADPVEEIVAQALAVPPAEWSAVFRDRYRGRGLILDAELQRDATGDWSAGYTPVVRGEDVILDLSAVRCLHEWARRDPRAFPPGRPRRVFLGLRLRDVSRPRPGAWAVTFEPDGLLLTELPPLLASCPALDPEEAGRILAAQKEAAGR